MSAPTDGLLILDGLRVRPGSITAYWRESDPLNRHLDATMVVVSGVASPVPVRVAPEQIDEALALHYGWNE